MKVKIPDDSPAARLAKMLPRRSASSSFKPTKPTWKCGLRERREALDLHKSVVAKAVGISPTCLYIIEHGGDPMLTNAVKLARFFGVSVESLWTPIEESVNTAAREAAERRAE